MQKCKRNLWKAPNWPKAKFYRCLLICFGRFWKMQLRSLLGAKSLLFQHIYCGSWPTRSGASRQPQNKQFAIPHVVPMSKLTHFWYYKHKQIRHSMFLDYLNTPKGFCSIWQHFPSLLDEDIAKICKKFNSHNGILRTDQGRAENNCQYSRLSYLAGSSKTHCKISISCLFLQSPHQLEMRNFVKYFKGFFWHFNTLETYFVKMFLPADR